jgi:hypothetical protein
MDGFLPFLPQILITFLVDHLILIFLLGFITCILQYSLTAYFLNLC